MAQKSTPISDDDLEKMILAKIAEGIKEGGNLDREIIVNVMENGRNIPTRKIATPKEYFDHWYNRVKASYVDINRHGVLWAMAQTPRLNMGSDIATTQQTTANVNDSDQDITVLKDVQLGMTNLKLKVKVITAEYLTGAKKDGTTYRMLKLSVKDATESLPLTIFWTRLLQPIFDAYDNHELVDSVLLITGSYFEQRDVRYPPNLSISTSGTVSICEEEMNFDENITLLKDLNEASTMVNVKGRIFYKSIPTMNSDKRKCVFVLVDSTGKMNCQAWNDAIDQIPENGSVVLINNAKYKHEDEYRKKKGFDPRLLNVGNNSVKVLENDPTIPTALSDAIQSEGSNMVYTLAEIQSPSDIFTGIVYLDHFASTKYDAQLQQRSPKEIWYLTCNKHKDTKYPKWIREQPDSSLLCPMCNATVNIADTIKHLNITATISDGTLWYQTTLSDDESEAVFGLPSDKLIKQYETTDHDKFFSLENLRAGGRMYKCEGQITIKDSGANFRINKIEPITYDLAFQYELEHCAPVK